MIKTKVYLAIRESCLPNRSPGSCPVIKIITDLPLGQDNSFYMDIYDIDNVPIDMTFDHDPTTYTKQATDLDTGDEIIFGIKKGLGKVIHWNNRVIRQRGYAFDSKK